MMACCAPLTVDLVHVACSNSTVHAICNERRSEQLKRKVHTCALGEVPFAEGKGLPV